MNIHLTLMTKELCRRYHKGFQYDPDMFTDGSHIPTYNYSAEHSDAHWQRQRDLNRVHLAVMLGDKPIGDLVLKNIDSIKKCCILGIHLQNDSCKNLGYGTEAEILALEYAFTKMGMDTVYADALLKNTRSRHVLEKVGFHETHRDAIFAYYICEKSYLKRTERGCK